MSAEILIPKTTIVVSGSSINSFDACVTKDYYENVLLLRPHEQALVLDKGTLMHKVLEIYYKFIKDSLPNPVDAAVIAGRKYAVELDLPAQEIEEVITHFNQYVYFYRGDGWEPLFVEESFSVVLYEDESIRVLYEGTIDLITLSLQGIKLVVDHKTGSRNKKPLGLSNQFMGYSFSLDTQTVVVNKILFYKTEQPPEKKFIRYTHNYDISQLNEWKENTINTAIKRFSYIKAKERDSNFQLPMNLTSCDKYGGCIYTHICGVAKEAREDIISRKYKVVEISHDEERFKDDE